MRAGETDTGGDGRPRLDCTEIVRQVCADDPAGMEALYAVFSRGLRYYLIRQFGAQDVDDKVHDIFLEVVQALRRGLLRDPERLTGFVHTIARRQVALAIDRTVEARAHTAGFESGLDVRDTRSGPEECLLQREEREVMTEVLREMAWRDREVLKRFYLEGQPQERICRELDLTLDQYRLVKNRAKSRFGQLGQQKLLPHPELQRLDPPEQEPIRAEPSQQREAIRGPTRKPRSP